MRRTGQGNRRLHAPIERHVFFFSLFVYCRFVQTTQIAYRAFCRSSQKNNQTVASCILLLLPLPVFLACFPQRHPRHFRAGGEARLRLLTQRVHRSRVRDLLRDLLHHPVRETRWSPKAQQQWLMVVSSVAGNLLANAVDVHVFCVRSNLARCFSCSLAHGAEDKLLILIELSLDDDEAPETPSRKPPLQHFFCTSTFFFFF